MSSSTSPPPITRLPSRRRSSALKQQTDDGGDSCRICRGEGTAEQPLFYPCKCSGSIKYVHQDCLMEWLSHSQKKYCELCKTPFRFTKLYSQSMPETVPWPLFLRQVLIHTTRALGRWARYAIVTFIWLCWLPWTIRQIWRALFWVADGSWLTKQEMQAAVEAYASRVSGNSSYNSTLSSSTTVGEAGSSSIGLISTLVAMLGILDPQTLLRAVVKTMLHIAVYPTIKGEPVSVDKSFLFAPIPRPPSLLSEVQTINAATRFPIFNNAFIDVLEGQLVCLGIVTAFILVFLIREWVINQQPLLNMPEQEQADHVAQPQQQNRPRQIAGRRRRVQNLPNDNNIRLENQLDLPVEAHEGTQPARRRASENNILVQDHRWNGDRPAAPQRAQSLVPALQELEDNARQLGRLQNLDSPLLVTESSATVEAPPLERGIFDEVGQIRRHMEERSTDEDTIDVPGSSVQTELSSQASSDRTHWDNGIIQNSTRNETPRDSPALSFGSRALAQDEFTFRADPTNTEPGILEPDHIQPFPSRADDEGELESEPAAVSTPVESSNANQVTRVSEPTNVAREGVEHIEDDSQLTQDTIAAFPEIQLFEEHEGMLARLSKWLWHTDDYIPGEPAQVEDDDTEIVADINGDAPLIREGHQGGLVDGDHPQVPQILPPNIQDGININDPNAIDEAEDLEGVLELIGMEGPIAGMVQNIIFSVFLITLTLSASIWCPYIWGKITLLFVAHPVSVFVKAPLYILSRVADFIVDIGLFSCGLLGTLLNYLARLVKVATLPIAPWFSSRIDTELVAHLSLKLSQNSGSRLEKTVTNTILGFRPDLPTFSVQSHHVLQVLTRTAERTSTNLGLSFLSLVKDASASATWLGALKIPFGLVKLAPNLPTWCLARYEDLRSWHTQLQVDLRPLSFSRPEEIDYSLVQWSAKEKITCIILGYLLFAVAGSLYLKLTQWYYGLKPGQKVPGFVADSLRQAGGVMKVIVIIGIEMIVFPLYCGWMLDIALLPVFTGATIQSRLLFLSKTPLTALFIHWFMGTCYMFHFALFVAMCRKLMRKGVLYFIRDPDDPAFHPVRDVLERPVLTQLGKIAFSAFVYGSLLVICLGGIILGLSRIGEVLPLNLGTYDPTMVIPGDIIFYNFMLPFILRKIKLSRTVSAIFQWWFHACAAGLRLSDFLFGVDNEEEKRSGAFLWRRFLHVLVSGDLERKHPMVKMIEELSEQRDHLLFLNSMDGNVTEDKLHEVFTLAHKFKIINLVDDRTKALIHFEESTLIEPLKGIIRHEAEKTDSKYRIRRVKDMKVDKFDWPYQRNTSVDPAAGTYIRAPAKDSVRIPKGTNVFLGVNEKNERLDGSTDPDHGLHGKQDDRFSRIYIPNHFRKRVSMFIGLMWIFAAVVGIFSTVGPLIVGRVIVRSVASSSSAPVNDLYAITIGVHAFVACIYLGHYIKTRWSKGMKKTTSLLHNTRQAIPFMLVSIRRGVGLLYLAITIGFIVPVMLSVVVELYINIPAYTYLVGSTTAGMAKEQMPANPFLSSTQGTYSTPIIPLLQTWAMGLLYIRIVLRFLTTTPHTNTRPAAAIRAIVRNGVLSPDIRLASRALVLPILAICMLLLGTPLVLARLVLVLRTGTLGDEQTVKIYRYAYPCLLSVAVACYNIYRLQTRIEVWRVKIRDEVYLIGERLHNFPGQDEESKKKRRSKNSLSKGKANEKATNTVDSQDATTATSRATDMGAFVEETPVPESATATQFKHEEAVQLNSRDHVSSTKIEDSHATVLASDSETESGNGILTAMEEPLEGEGTVPNNQ